MNKRLSISLLAALASVAACGSDDGASTGTGGAAGGASGEPTCADVCSRIMSVGCPNDSLQDCNAKCASVLSPSLACQPEVKAYLQCGLSHPNADWECDTKNEADLKAGICDVERTAMSKCGTP